MSDSQQLTDVAVLAVSADHRGDVFEPLDAERIATMKNVHVLVTRPGEVRGNHSHRHRADRRRRTDACMHRFVCAGIVASAVGCAPASMGSTPVSPVEIIPATVVSNDRLGGLIHGARVRLVLAGPGDEWHYGVLSLEGRCVVWLRDNTIYGKYVDFERVERVSVSNVQTEPRNGWPMGIMGPVPGEQWREAAPATVDVLRRRCAPSHVG